MKHWFKKSVSVVVLVFFVVNSCFADIAGLGIEFSSGTEMPQLMQIDIPAELASVEEFWEAPPRPNPKMVLQIQNAHTNYEAQNKIRDLMSYLNKNYGFKTIFVEGASENLNPDYLRLFPDAETNRKLWDELAKRGQITGADWFLLEETGGARGVGIEDAGLYRQNYEALKAVYEREEESARFLTGLEMELDKLATQKVPAEIRGVIAEWKKFEKGHREFIPFVESLADFAKKSLQIDLHELYSQIEWPQLTRLLVLQEMEKKLDTRSMDTKTQRELAEQERGQMIEWMKRNNIRKELVEGLERFNEKNINMNRIRASSGKIESLPRFFVEKLIEEAGPKGLRFSDYPNFALYTGYLILRYEIEPNTLFSEIRLLFEKILDRAAKDNPETEPLIRLFRDAELLRKLFNLELSREEWGRVLARKAGLEPQIVFNRVKSFDEKRAENRSSPEPTEYQKKILNTYESALSFYDFAVRRDEVFYEKMSAELEKTDKAILMTGGFHTEGLREIFREKEISYGTITPRLTQVEKSNLYRDVMLGKANALPTTDRRPQTTDTVEIVSLLQSLDAFKNQGLSWDLFTDQLMQALLAINTNREEAEGIVAKLNTDLRGKAKQPDVSIPQLVVKDKQIQVRSESRDASPAKVIFEPSEPLEISEIRADDGTTFRTAYRRMSKNDFETYHVIDLSHSNEKGNFKIGFIHFTTDARSGEAVLNISFDDQNTFDGFDMVGNAKEGINVLQYSNDGIPNPLATIVDEEGGLDFDGLGSTLLYKAMQIARENGMRQFTARNVLAPAFFEKNGFEKNLGQYVFEFSGSDEFDPRPIKRVSTRSESRKASPLSSEQIRKLTDSGFKIERDEVSASDAVASILTPRTIDGLLKELRSILREDQAVVFKIDIPQAELEVGKDLILEYLTENNEFFRRELPESSHLMRRLDFSGGFRDSKSFTRFKVLVAKDKQLDSIPKVPDGKERFIFLVSDEAEKPSEGAIAITAQSRIYEYKTWSDMLYAPPRDERDRPTYYVYLDIPKDAAVRSRADLESYAARLIEIEAAQKQGPIEKLLSRWVKPKLPEQLFIPSDLVVGVLNRSTGEFEASRSEVRELPDMEQWKSEAFVASELLVSLGALGGLGIITPILFSIFSTLTAAAVFLGLAGGLFYLIRELNRSFKLSSAERREQSTFSWLNQRVGQLSMPLNRINELGTPLPNTSAVRSELRVAPKLAGAGLILGSMLLLAIYAPMVGAYVAGVLLIVGAIQTFTEWWDKRTPKNKKNIEPATGVRLQVLLPGTPEQILHEKIKPWIYIALALGYFLVMTVVHAISVGDFLIQGQQKDETAKMALQVEANLASRSFDENARLVSNSIMNVIDQIYPSASEQEKKDLHDLALFQTGMESGLFQYADQKNWKKEGYPSIDIAKGIFQHEVTRSRTLGDHVMTWLGYPSKAGDARRIDQEFLAQKLGLTAQGEAKPSYKAIVELRDAAIKKFPNDAGFQAEYIARALAYRVIQLDLMDDYELDGFFFFVKEKRVKSRMAKNGDTLRSMAGDLPGGVFNDKYFRTQESPASKKREIADAIKPYTFSYGNRQGGWGASFIETKIAEKEQAEPQVASVDEVLELPEWDSDFEVLGASLLFPPLDQPAVARPQELPAVATEPLTAETDPIAAVRSARPEESLGEGQLEAVNAASGKISGWYQREIDIPARQLVNRLSPPEGISVFVFFAGAALYFLGAVARAIAFKLSPSASSYSKLTIATGKFALAMALSGAIYGYVYAAVAILSNWTSLSLVIGSLTTLQLVVLMEAPVLVFFAMMITGKMMYKKQFRIGETFLRTLPSEALPKKPSAPSSRSEARIQLQDGSVLEGERAAEKLIEVLRLIRGFVPGAEQEITIFDAEKINFTIRDMLEKVGARSSRENVEEVKKAYTSSKFDLPQDLKDSEELLIFFGTTIYNLLHAAAVNFGGDPASYYSERARGILALNLARNLGFVDSEARIAAGLIFENYGGDPNKLLADFNSAGITLPAATPSDELQNRLIQLNQKIELILEALDFQIEQLGVDPRDSILRTAVADLEHEGERILNHDEVDYVFSESGSHRSEARTLSRRNFLKISAAGGVAAGANEVLKWINQSEGEPEIASKTFRGDVFIDTRDYRIGLMEYDAAINKPDTYILSPANLFSKSKQPLGLWRIIERQPVGEFNTNQSGKSIAKAIFLISKDGEIKIISAQEFNQDLQLPKNRQLYSEENYPEAFQAGPLIKVDGKVNQSIFEWHRGFLGGRRVAIGHDAVGRFFVKEFYGIDFMGFFGMTASRFQKKLDAWIDDNRIESAMFVDGGTTGFGVGQKIPPAVIVAQPKRSEVRVVDLSPEQIADWVAENFGSKKYIGVESWKNEGLPMPFSDYPALIRDFPVSKLQRVLTILRERQQKESGSHFLATFMQAMLSYGVRGAPSVAEFRQYYGYFGIDEKNPEYIQNFAYFSPRTARDGTIFRAFYEKIQELYFEIMKIYPLSANVELRATEYFKDLKTIFEGRLGRRLTQYESDFSLVVMLGLIVSKEEKAVWNIAELPVRIHLGTIKGEVVEVVQRAGEKPEIIVTRDGLSSDDKTTREVLTYQFTEEKNQISIGRQSSNDYVVSDADISREHLVWTWDDQAQELRVSFKGSKVPFIEPLFESEQGRADSRSEMRSIFGDISESEAQENFQKVTGWVQAIQTKENNFERKFAIRKIFTTEKSNSLAKQIFLLYLMGDPDHTIRRTAVEANHWNSSEFGVTQIQISPSLLLQHLKSPWTLSEELGFYSESNDAKQKEIRDRRLTVLTTIISLLNFRAETKLQEYRDEMLRSVKSDIDIEEQKLSSNENLRESAAQFQAWVNESESLNLVLGERREWSFWEVIMVELARQAQNPEDQYKWIRGWIGRVLGGMGVEAHLSLLQEMGVEKPNKFLNRSEMREGLGNDVSWDDKEGLVVGRNIVPVLSQSGNRNDIFGDKEAGVAYRVFREAGESREQDAVLFEVMSNRGIAPRVLRHGFVRSSGNSANQYYVIAVDYLDGKSLDLLSDAEILERREKIVMGLKEALRLAIEGIAENRDAYGMQDFRPANAFLTQDGRVFFHDMDYQYMLNYGEGQASDAAFPYLRNMEDAQYADAWKRILGLQGYTEIIGYLREKDNMRSEMRLGVGISDELASKLQTMKGFLPSSIISVLMALPENESVTFDLGASGNYRTSKKTVAQWIEEFERLGTYDGRKIAASDYRLDSAEADLGLLADKFEGNWLRGFYKQGDRSSVFDVEVEFESGEAAVFSGNVDLILQLAQSDLVKKVAPSSSVNWFRPLYSLPQERFSSDFNLQNELRAELESAEHESFGRVAFETKASNTDIPGMEVFHGTFEGAAESVQSGPRNLGEGFGGAGLYLAVEGERDVAEFFADKAGKESVSRTQGIKEEDSRVDFDLSKTQPIVLSGRINPNKNLRVGVFEIQRDASPNLERGVLPANWDDDPRLKRLLESEFDILDLRNMRANGLVIDTNRMLVVHERAGTDAVLWESTPQRSLPGRQAGEMRNFESFDQLLKHVIGVSGSKNLQYLDLDTGTGSFIPEFISRLESVGGAVQEDGFLGAETVHSYVADALKPRILGGTAQIAEDYRDLPKEAFDLITVNNIESSPHTLIQRAAELLKPDGFLLVSIERFDHEEGGVTDKIRGLIDSQAGLELYSEADLLNGEFNYPQYVSVGWAPAYLLIARKQRSEMRSPAAEEFLRLVKDLFPAETGTSDIEKLFSDLEDLASSWDDGYELKVAGKEEDEKFLFSIQLLKNGAEPEQPPSFNPDYQQGVLSILSRLKANRPDLSLTIAPTLDGDAYEYDDLSIVYLSSYRSERQIKMIRKARSGEEIFFQKAAEVKDEFISLIQAHLDPDLSDTEKRYALFLQAGYLISWAILLSTVSSAEIESWLDELIKGESDPVNHEALNGFRELILHQDKRGSLHRFLETFVGHYYGDLRKFIQIQKDNDQMSFDQIIQASELFSSDWMAVLAYAPKKEVLDWLRAQLEDLFFKVDMNLSEGEVEEISKKIYESVSKTRRTKMEAIEDSRQKGFFDIDALLVEASLNRSEIRSLDEAIRDFNNLLASVEWIQSSEQIRELDLRVPNGSRELFRQLNQFFYQQVRNPSNKQKSEFLSLIRAAYLVFENRPQILRPQENNPLGTFRLKAAENLKDLRAQIAAAIFEAFPNEALDAFNWLNIIFPNSSREDLMDFLIRHFFERAQNMKDFLGEQHLAGIAILLEDKIMQSPEILDLLAEYYLAMQAPVLKTINLPGVEGLREGDRYLDLATGLGGVEILGGYSDAKGNRFDLVLADNNPFVAAVLRRLAEKKQLTTVKIQEADIVDFFQGDKEEFSVIRLKNIWNYDERAAGESFWNNLISSVRPGGKVILLAMQSDKKVSLFRSRIESLSGWEISEQVVDDPHSPEKGPKYIEWTLKKSLRSESRDFQGLSAEDMVQEWNGFASQQKLQFLSDIQKYIGDLRSQGKDWKNWLAGQEFLMFAIADADFEVRRRIVEMNQRTGQPFMLPIDFLMQHLKDPALSLSLVQKIENSEWSLQRSLNNKRLTLFILFIDLIRKGERYPVDADYLSSAKAIWSQEIESAVSEIKIDDLIQLVLREGLIWIDEMGRGHEWAQKILSGQTLTDTDKENRGKTLRAPNFLGGESPMSLAEIYLRQEIMSDWIAWIARAADPYAWISEYTGSREVRAVTDSRLNDLIGIWNEKLNGFAEGIEGGIYKSTAAQLIAQARLDVILHDGFKSAEWADAAYQKWVRENPAFLTNYINLLRSEPHYESNGFNSRVYPENAARFFSVLHALEGKIGVLPDKKILDLGSGSGRLSIFGAKGFGAHMYPVEIISPRDGAVQRTNELFEFVETLSGIGAIEPTEFSDGLSADVDWNEYDLIVSYWNGSSLAEKVRGLDSNKYVALLLDRNQIYPAQYPELNEFQVGEPIPLFMPNDKSSRVRSYLVLLRGGRVESQSNLADQMVPSDAYRSEIRLGEVADKLKNFEADPSVAVPILVAVIAGGFVAPLSTVVTVGVITAALTVIAAIISAEKPMSSEQTILARNGMSNKEAHGATVELLSSIPANFNDIAEVLRANPLSSYAAVIKNGNEADLKAIEAQYGDLGSRFKLYAVSENGLKNGLSRALGYIRGQLSGAAVADVLTQVVVTGDIQDLASMEFDGKPVSVIAYDSNLNPNTGLVRYGKTVLASQSLVSVGVEGIANTLGELADELGIAEKGWLFNSDKLNRFAQKVALEIQAAAKAAMSA